MDTECVAQILQTNYQFLTSLYIEEIERNDAGFYAWTEANYHDTNVFWNHAVVFNQNEITENLIADIEAFYKEKDRTPAIYLPLLNGTKTDSRLPEYTSSFTDAWMFYGGNSSGGKDAVVIDRVEKEDEMKNFVDLFYQSHAADLDDPYAGLSREYGRQLKKSFSNQSSTNTVRHYLVKFEGDSVGHITTISDGTHAAIYNLGTIPEYRGKGIATATLQETVKKLNDEVETIFLQTEEGSENEAFFRKRGFKTKFTASCFEKNVDSF